MNRRLWKKTGRKLNLGRQLTRTVFTEKFNLEKFNLQTAIENRAKDFFISKINGCQAFKASSKDNPNKNIIFYVKSSQIMFAINQSASCYWIRLPDFWVDLKTIYELFDKNIAILAKQWLKELIPEITIKMSKYHKLSIIKMLNYDIKMFEKQLLESKVFYSKLKKKKKNEQKSQVHGKLCKKLKEHE